MLEVVVASGKGGAGKSLVAAALAKGLGAVAADCDVEAPDLAFLLGGVVEEISRKEVVESRKAWVDYSKCFRCLNCYRVCRFGAVRVEHGKPVVDEVLCEGCMACSLVCTGKAIGAYMVRTGYIVTARTGSEILLVTGDLEPAGKGSGHLVASVKEEARKYASRLRMSTVVVDAAAGIGCPVISSMAGASHLIIIAEPTPQGVQGARRLLEASRGFQCKKALVVNKALEGFIDPEKIARELGLELLGVIPYDPSIPKLYAKAVNPLNQDSPASRALRELVEVVKEWLGA